MLFLCRDDGEGASNSSQRAMADQDMESSSSSSEAVSLGKNSNWVSFEPLLSSCSLTSADNYYMLVLFHSDFEPGSVTYSGESAFRNSFCTFQFSFIKN